MDPKFYFGHTIHNNKRTIKVTGRPDNTEELIGGKIQLSLDLKWKDIFLIIEKETLVTNPRFKLYSIPSRFL